MLKMHPMSLGVFLFVCCHRVTLEQHLKSHIKSWSHVCVRVRYKKCCPHGLSSCLTVADRWPLGAQEYLKLSDVYKMYGSCSGRHESSKPAAHGRSFAVDAALAGACEVPFTSCLSLSWFFTVSLSLSLHPFIFMSCCSLCWFAVNQTVLLCATWACGVSSCS